MHKYEEDNSPMTYQIILYDKNRKFPVGNYLVKMH